MNSMISDKIIEIVGERKKSIVDDIRFKRSLERDIFHDDRKTLSEAIKDNKGISIISEIKPASPTLGSIRENIDVKQIAKEMEESGVIGLSVLTEPNYFNGSYDNLKDAVRSTSIPCLMKDFVVDSVQCFIAYQLGATNILIINSTGDYQSHALFHTACECHLEPLIEIHDVKEIEDIRNLKEIGLTPKIVGVNNRNLRTLEISLNTSREIIPKLKDEFGNEIIVISESGINSYDDIKDLLEYGADGFLIGSSIMQSNNIKEKILELRGEK